MHLILDKLNVVKFLIEHGADINSENATDYFGRTALHYAATNGNNIY